MHDPRGDGILLLRPSARPEQDTGVVIFPHAGCGATSAQPIADRLAGPAVYAAEYPGRGRRANEDFADDVNALAAALADDVERLPVRHLTLFGHSFGAIVAYEVGRRMELHDRAPHLLVASSCVNPFRMAEQRRSVHQVTDTELLDLLVERGGMSQSELVNVDFLDYVLPVIRSDTRIGELHRPARTPLLGTTVLAVGGEDDPTVSVDDLRSWADVVAGPASVELVPGDHFHHLQYPDRIADLVARRAATCCSRSLQATSTKFTG